MRSSVGASALAGHRLGRRSVSMGMLVATAFVAGSCGGSSESNASAPTSSERRVTTTTSTSSSTTTAVTTPPTTTVPAPVAPPPSNLPLGDTPVGIDSPTDPAAGPGIPTAGTVRPPAAFLGNALPQPGSMFEDFSADRSLDGKGKFVALTFDDGPTQYTKPIVDILKFTGVKATFFQLSPQTANYLDLTKQMLADGMHIGAHTRRHPRLNEVDAQRKIDEVQGSIDDLNGLLGPGTVKCFRPPFARYDQQVLDLVAQRNAATAMWSVETRDWEKPAWPAIVERAVNGARDRSVILMHDGGGDRTQTIAALPWIIAFLKGQGYQFIPVC